jgi:hypothetical protein
MIITLLRDNCWTQLGGAVFEVKKKRDRNHATPREDSIDGSGG